MILTDIRMPDGDGRRLFEEIRHRWPRQASRVVFVTGDTLASDLRDMLLEERPEFDSFARTQDFPRYPSAITQDLLDKGRELFAFILNEISIPLDLAGVAGKFGSKIESCGADYGERRAQFVRNA